MTAPSLARFNPKDIDMKRFEYLMNAMDRAAWEANPADHDYKGKREKVFEFVGGIIAEYKEICERLQACVQTYGLGLGGERIDVLVVEEVERLVAFRNSIECAHRRVKAVGEEIAAAIEAIDS